MIRTFIALELPDELKEKLIQIRNEFYTDDRKIRWEAKNKLHLTLKFLGDTEKSKIHKIWDEVLKVLEQFKSLTMTFNGFGIFKRDGQPRIFWAGFDENKVLENLTKEIDNRCMQFGFPVEKRKFSPHLTLLRIKGNEKIDLIYKIVNTKFEPVNFVADTITFYKSELKPSGSEYAVLKQILLNKE